MKKQQQKKIIMISIIVVVAIFVLALIFFFLQNSKPNAIQGFNITLLDSNKKSISSSSTKNTLSVVNDVEKVSFLNISYFMISENPIEYNVNFFTPFPFTSKIIPSSKQEQRVFNSPLACYQNCYEKNTEKYVNLGIIDVRNLTGDYTISANLKYKVFGNIKESNVSYVFHISSDKVDVEKVLSEPIETETDACYKGNGHYIFPNNGTCYCEKLQFWNITSLNCEQMSKEDICIQGGATLTDNVCTCASTRKYWNETTYACETIPGVKYIMD